jgi:hypothetical protein
MQSHLLSCDGSWMILVSRDDARRLGKGRVLHLRARAASDGDFEPAVMLRDGRISCSVTAMCTFVSFPADQLEPDMMVSLGPGWLLTMTDQ